MYICHDCEHVNATKLGKCPHCGAFGTFIKDPTKVKKSKTKSVRNDNMGVALSSSGATASVWYALQHPELERILQKGVKKGGLYLLGGEPGIGKSTIMLQIIQQLTQHNNINIGYFSGEEDVSQITERKERIEGDGKSGAFDIYQAHHLEDILATTESNKYDCIIIDSIQTVYTPNHESVAGSIAQIKWCSEKISEWCKSNGVACFLIGHVTKGGEIAGPKYLEHIVDVVMYLEGDRYGQYRFLRTKKNRFGPSDEVSIFEMAKKGLVPVYDLKERIMSSSSSNPGNVLTVGIDNGRPVLVHLEVLLNKANGKYPQRVCQGIDQKRLQIVSAILEKYLKINVSFFDIYVNIPGEFSFKDTGLDLALASAIYSQAKNIVIDQELIFVGELGLGGQVLQSKLHTKRTNEAKDFTIIDYQRMKHISELAKIL